MFELNSKKIGIVGVGLIGGSIGMRLKNRGWGVIGVGRNEERLKLAKKLGAIDRYSLKFDILNETNFVVVATPVDTISSISNRLIAHLKKGTIVMDVGSVKDKIIKDIKTTDGIYFIGAHPIAGSEKSSVKYANPDLFQNTYCVITPTEGAPRWAIDRVMGIWEELGAKCIIMDSVLHDKLLAFTSHLPHIISASLCNTIKNIKYKDIKKVVGNSLKDLTRITASDPGTWAKIIFFNEKNLREAIRSFISEMRKFERNLKNIPRAKNLFASARKIKNKWLR